MNISRVVESATPTMTGTVPAVAAIAPLSIAFAANVADVIAAAFSFAAVIAAS
jgi:hypothetical protein